MEPLHKKYLTEQRLKLQERQARGETGLAVAGWHASFIDVFIISVFNSLEIRGQLSQGREETECVVLGLGGYGRKELSPFSDIDLLFLFPGPIESPAEEIIRKILYPLWDVGYEVGYTVQSLDECLDMAGSELSFLTALLDLRRITGNPPLAQTLKTRIKALLKQDLGRRWQEWVIAEKGKAAFTVRGFGFFPGTSFERGTGGSARSSPPALDREGPL